jgi:hypothetical protein
VLPPPTLSLGPPAEAASSAPPARSGVVPSSPALLTQWLTGHPSTLAAVSFSGVHQPLVSLFSVCSQKCSEWLQLHNPQAAWRLRLHLRETSAGSCHSHLRRPSTQSQLRRPNRRRRRSQRRQQQQHPLPVADGERRCCPPTRRQPVRQLQPWRPRSIGLRVCLESSTSVLSSLDFASLHAESATCSFNLVSLWPCRW